MINIDNIRNIDWSKCCISILGAGRSGIAATKLAQNIGAEIFLSENQSDIQLPNELQNIKYEVGGHTNKVLDANLIIISPGISDRIDIIQQGLSRGIPLVSEIEFSSWFTTKPILALTGSNGKTTTATLLNAMLTEAGYSSLLGGNVGVPFSENILIEQNSSLKSIVHVLELSSFQLEHIIHFAPRISCILNISADHLDRYTDINEYMNAKLNIARNLVAPDWLVYNADDSALFTSLRDRHRTKLFSLESSHQAHYHVNATKVYSGENNNTPKILFNLEDTLLKGSHNLENILAAATMAHLFGIPDEYIGNAIISFTPIPHRLEEIRDLNGVLFINDSKATNLASTAAALDSFSENVILILGGQKKGNTNFTELLPQLKCVKCIICYGDVAEIIEAQLSSKYEISVIPSFADSINQAVKSAKSGDTVLLSPACASFDQFENFEDRGNTFRKLVLELEESNAE